MWQQRGARVSLLVRGDKTRDRGLPECPQAPQPHSRKHGGPAQARPHPLSFLATPITYCAHFQRPSLNARWGSTPVTPDTPGDLPGAHVASKGASVKGPQGWAPGRASRRVKRQL